MVLPTFESDQSQVLAGADPGAAQAFDQTGVIDSRSDRQRRVSVVTKVTVKPLTQAKYCPKTPQTQNSEN